MNRQRELAEQQPAPPLIPKLSMRPREVSAIAAAIVALVAVAVLLFPASTPAVSTTKVAAPGEPVVEQTLSRMDDGAPSSTVNLRSSGALTHHCDHEM
jgi:hypothetical protein